MNNEEAIKNNLQKSSSVLVLGGGVIGLTSAIVLQKAGYPAQSGGYCKKPSPIIFRA